MKLLIGTQNAGKFGEMGKFIGPGFELVSLNEVGKPIPTIEETGTTFEENAILKAVAYFTWSGIPTVADDSGLEIDALDGEPGVKSRRWPGYEASDEELIAMALGRLAGVATERRTAHLRMVGAFHDGRRTLTATAAINGLITDQQMVPHQKGYPFRSIFHIPQFQAVYEQLTEEQHEAVNHRREAYHQLRELILTTTASS